MAAIGEERTSLMILRAWVEPDHEHALRVRIIQPYQGDGGGPVVRAFASVDDVCAAIRAWLLDLEGR
jgi:hypothetical protein